MTYFSPTVTPSPELQKERRKKGSPPPPQPPPASSPGMLPGSPPGKRGEIQAPPPDLVLCQPRGKGVGKASTGSQDTVPTWAHALG